jgi:hypothetical protein
MPSYRWLDAWAQRDQRHFDAQRARPPREPGTEPLPARILNGVVGTVTTATKLVTIPALSVWTIMLIARHTVRSLVLAVAVGMILSTSVLTGVMVVQHRRAHGRNVITGNARRPTTPRA